MFTVSVSVSKPTISSKLSQLYIFYVMIVNFSSALQILRFYFWASENYTFLRLTCKTTLLNRVEGRQKRHFPPNKFSITGCDFLIPKRLLKSKH